MAGGADLAEHFPAALWMARQLENYLMRLDHLLAIPVDGAGQKPGRALAEAAFARAEAGATVLVDVVVPRG